jgi:hypothetical protein
VVSTALRVGVELKTNLVCFIVGPRFWGQWEILSFTLRGGVEAVVAAFCLFAVVAVEVFGSLLLDGLGDGYA